MRINRRGRDCRGVRGQKRAHPGGRGMKATSRNTSELSGSESKPPSLERGRLSKRAHG